MGEGGRSRRSRWGAAALLAVAAAFLVARVLPSDGPAAGPTVDADLPTWSAEEAGAHVGEVGRVCGTVESAAWVRSVGGQPTYLNLGRPHPDQLFTVVIWGEDRARFGTPERRWNGRRICVAGRVRTHEGTPRIVARRPAQIGPRTDGPAGDSSP